MRVNYEIEFTPEELTQLVILLIQALGAETAKEFLDKVNVSNQRPN